MIGSDRVGMSDRVPYRGRRLRLRSWDYATPAYYFVTICTYRRMPLLGRVTDGRMRESEAGRIVRRVIDEFERTEGALRVFEVVVMPDHVHVILELLPVERPRTLSGVIGAIKSISARRINEQLGRTGPVWQRSFADRIIRDEREFEAAVAYMRDNPRRWSEKYGP
ncbi:MAG: hypothetical protein D6738_02940 [Acidobacteria bacterium]|nr:MAG: hypothetical protein D6738_02940 [Acidobacteriota bacterium]